MAEWEAATGKPIPDTLATWGAVHYMMTAKAMLNNRNGRARLKMLQRLCRDAVALQRGETRTARLELDHQRLAFFQKRRVG